MSEFITTSYRKQAGEHQKTKSIFSGELQNFAAYLLQNFAAEFCCILGHERSEKLQRVLTSSNKESSRTVFFCMCMFVFSNIPLQVH